MRGVEILHKMAAVTCWHDTAHHWSILGFNNMNVNTTKWAHRLHARSRGHECYRKFQLRTARPPPSSSGHLQQNGSTPTHTTSHIRHFLSDVSINIAKPTSFDDGHTLAGMNLIRPNRVTIKIAAWLYCVHFLV